MAFYKEQELKSFLPSSTKPLKKKEVKVSVGGVTIVAKIKGEAALTRNFKSYSCVYDMYDAIQNHLSKEEVADRDDPQRISDSYIYARPEVSHEIRPLSDEEVEQRLGFIKDCYRLLDDDEFVKAVVVFAQKKKDGSLYKKKHTRIACAGIVTSDFQVFEIEGYAESDTEIEIRGSWVDFDDELKNIEADFVSNNPACFSASRDSITGSEKGLPTQRSCKFIYTEQNGLKKKELSASFYVASSNGEDYLADRPLSSLKCLIKEGPDTYRIDISKNSFDLKNGVAYKGALISSNLHCGVSSAMDKLELGPFSPVNDEIRGMMADAQDYYGLIMEQTAGLPIEEAIKKENKAFSKVPKGMKAYHPEYSREESLARLLELYDRICAFSDSDVDEFLNALPLTKDKSKVKRNLDFLIFQDTFYMPAREYNSDFLRVQRGGIPSLIVLTRTNKIEFIILSLHTEYQFGASEKLVELIK